MVMGFAELDAAGTASWECTSVLAAPARTVGDVGVAPGGDRRGTPTWIESAPRGEPDEGVESDDEGSRRRGRAPDNPRHRDADSPGRVEVALWLAARGRVGKWESGWGALSRRPVVPHRRLRASGTAEHGHTHFPQTAV